MFRCFCTWHSNSFIWYMFSVMYVCMYVCLSVCMCACTLYSYDNFRKPWRRNLFCSSGTSWGNTRHVRKCRGNISSSNNNYGSIEDRAVKFACSTGFQTTADRMAWPLSLSRDRKWSGLNKYTHSRVVWLLLAGNLVCFVFAIYRLVELPLYAFAVLSVTER